MSRKTSAPPTFSENLKFIREEKNLTQRELSIKSGITERIIQKYESNTGKPNYDCLIALSKALDISLDYLAGLTDEPNAPATTTIIEKKIELPDEEAAMLDAFRKCSPEAQIYLLNKAKVMAYEEQHKSMEEETATGEENAALLA